MEPESTSESYQLDDASKAKWYRVVFDLKKQFGKKPDMNGILFLIGVREYGQMREFAKHEKMDLMHIATCKLLSYEGFYAFENTDADGWPHYRMLKNPPFANLLSQENKLRKLVVTYFEENNLFESDQTENP